MSRLLGHTSIKLTADVYSYVLPKERDEAARHFDRMFRIAKRESRRIKARNFGSLISPVVSASSGIRSPPLAT